MYAFSKYAAGSRIVYEKTEEALLNGSVRVDMKHSYNQNPMSESLRVNLSVQQGLFIEKFGLLLWSKFIQRMSNTLNFNTEAVFIISHFFPTAGNSFR